MNDDAVREYFEQFEGYALLSSRAERALLEEVHWKCLGQHVERHCGEGRELLVKHNMRLVLSNAAKVCNRSAPWFVDLLQAGAGGMTIAIDRFDITAGTRFSTYAVWWIKSRIYEEARRWNPKILKSGTLLENYNRARNELTALAGDVEHDQIIEYLVEHFKWDSKKVLAFQQGHNARMVSLDGIGDRDDQQRSPDETILLQERQDRLARALRKLETHEILLIVDRYVHGRSYRDLTNMFRVTREAVRQLENRILRRLWAALLDDASRTED